MAVFIPEWVRVSGRRIQVKQVLGRLDDAHTVRAPLRAQTCPAELFVAHADKGWLALASNDIAYAELDPDQLFPGPAVARFEAGLEALQRLGTTDAADRPVVDALVLMWACTPAQVRDLTRRYLATYGTRLVSREQFMALGDKLVHGLLAPLAAETRERLMSQYFPETEIVAACTARRSFRRDNQARLTRSFLDREQEWAAKLDLDLELDLALPPQQADTARDMSMRLVNGVAGSGKTLIAVSRARLLAEHFPTQRVLLLIHNTPIVADLRERLHRAHGALPPNLEIATFFAWASAQWRRVFGGPPRLPENPRILADLVRRQHARWPDIRLSDAQLIEELDFINETLVDDEAAYLQASRAGRGVALRAKEHSLVWALHGAVTAELAAAQLRMWSALPREICLAGDSATARLATYRQVLVDEAQFFAPSWFRLVKLSLAPQGRLFLCADPNQGFMKSRLSWKRVGLDVAGRTKKLRHSYRTTRALLEAANQALAVVGPADADDYLAPDYAGMEAGDRPLLLYADSPQDALDRVVNEIAAIAGGVPLNALLVIYGDQVQKFGLYRQLERRLGSGKVWWFNQREHKKLPPSGYGQDHLRLAYVDTATGLEASVVFLLGIEDLLVGAVDPRLAAEEQAERREAGARKLYMAMTRAAQRLIVISARRLPAAMERLFDLAE